MGNANDPYIKTPNMDKLASEGTKFTNAYTNCPVCVPARMSLLSGQLPLDHGTLVNQATLNNNIPTFAHSMTIGGYQTVLAGRMHIHGADQHRGHEVRLTGDNTPLYLGGPSIMPRIPKELRPTIMQKRAGIDYSGGGNCVVQGFDNAVASDAIEFLDKRNDDRPLMMTVGFFSPHPPFIADSKKFKYYYNLLEDAPMHPNFEENLHPAIKEWKRRRKIDDTITKDDWRRVRAAYYANTEFLDENIGKVIEAARRNLNDNTIFIYSSDHGDSIGINNLLWKTTFYESSVKIPLIVSGPGIKKGREVNGLVCLNDLTRTFIEYGGGPELDKPYGQSLRNVLENSEEINEDRSIISQIGTYGKNPDDIDLPSAMIRKGDYKLISYHGYDEVSLFNVTDDPLCGNDLRNQERYDNLKISLLTELNEVWDSSEALRLSNQSMVNFNIMHQWARKTKFPLINRFYNGLTNSMTPNWDMDEKNVYIEVTK
jgi:choline-sulfatase